MENKDFGRIESRKFPRIEINLTIDSEINEEFKAQFRLLAEKSFKVDAKDISEGGVGIVCKYYLPAGVVLDLDIDGTPFGLQTKIKTKAEVRFCAFAKDVGYRCGIKFLNMDEKDRKAIADFVKANERRKSPRLQLEE